MSLYLGTEGKQVRYSNKPSMQTVERIWNFYSKHFNLTNSYTKVFVLFAFLLGSYLRFINLFNPGYYFDTIVTQYEWGKYGYVLGYIGFWREYSGFFDYLPISLLIDTCAYIFSLLFGGNGYYFVIALKSFNWIVEICLSLFIVYIGLNFFRSGFNQKSATDQASSKHSDKNNLPSRVLNRIFITGATTYIIPSLWFVSALWGQIDSLVAFLGLLSLYLLYDSTNYDSNPKSGQSKALWSGIIFGIDMWIKQQVFLLIPIFGLYYLYKKTRSDWLFIILTTVFLISALFSLPYLKVPLPSVVEAMVISGILILFTSAAYFSLRKQDNWSGLKRQLFGIALVSTLVVAPLTFVNLERLKSSFLAVVLRDNSISRGAHTFWYIFYPDGRGSDTVFNFAGFNLSVNTAGYSIYAILMLVLFLVFFKIKRFNDLKHVANIKMTFLDLAVFATINCSLYFLVFTKIHSRYLHFGIIFSLVSLALLSNYKWLWRFWFGGILVFHLSYFFNQLVVQSYYDNPYWPKRWIAYAGEKIGPDIWKINAIILSITFLYIYILAIKYFSLPKGSKLPDYDLTR